MGSITVFPVRRVITMDPGRPVAEAVAVMDGKVLSTGSLRSMQPWLTRHPHVIDDTLQTKVILPGFIDPHTHFGMSPGFLAMLYVGPIESPGPAGMNPASLTHEAVLARLREADRHEKDPTKPLVAWGLDPAVQGGHLHRDELDTITRERPIWVIAYAPHFVYLNGPALARSGVPDDTAVHGVQRYEDGRLNGVFAESDAMQLAARGMPVEMSLEGGVRGLWHMADIARRAGITTTAEMGFGFRDFELEWPGHATAVNDRAFPLRMALVPFEGPLYETYAGKTADFLLGLADRNSEKLFFHGIKFLADGSLPAMSARVNGPGYLDGTNGFRGDVPWNDLPQRMLPFWKAGIQIHCHANGDEAIDAALDALAALQRMHPRFDHRFTIEHYSISTPDQRWTRSR